MNNVIALFLERLADRLTALLAGLVSSRVEELHATIQAEQQSQLEDLARKYEAEGKPEIAETLRQRSLRLTSANLAAGAVESVQQLASEPLKLSGPTASTSTGDLAGLPDFGTPPARSRGRKARTDNVETPTDVSGDVS
jgi:hypothetical protein